jgi:hypothetical protein
MNRIVSSLGKLNQKLIDFFELPLVKYGFLIIVVLQIIFINYISDASLEIFENTYVKIVFALFVAYSACFDPIYAIALTTFIIISIQELHQRRSKSTMTTTTTTTFDNSIKNFMGTEFDNKANIISRQKINYENIPSTGQLVNDELVYKLINKHALQKQPANDDKLIAEYDYYEDPAFKTITSNLQQKNILGNNQLFVTDEDLTKAQTNTEENVNQNSSMQGFAGNVLNIQGLPNGFNPKDNMLGILTM